MNHQEFKNKWIWKKVEENATLWAQCVSLAKQYAKEVHNITFGKTWNAKDWFIKSVWTALWYQKVNYTPWKIAPQGAIIFRGYGTYGHVAIVDSATVSKVNVLEQNGVWDNPSTPQDEAWNWIGWNAIRLRETTYNNILWWLVDPTTSKVVDNALLWNSQLRQATNEQPIRDILKNTNENIRKYYE